MNYRKPGLVLIVLILFLFIDTFQIKAQSQTLPQGIPQNVSNVNVNDLTDAQIRQLLLQAQSSGLSDAQVIQQAQARGMSDDQAQLLQKRIADVRAKDGILGSPGSGSDTSYQSSSRRLNYKDTSNQQNSVSTSLKPKIFGSDLFRNKNMKFEPNLKMAT
ncbi:MAG: kpsD, partial [Mucilaginibacter sp.]|nr:kpsD [Mucilaginibacter sp.]